LMPRSNAERLSQEAGVECMAVRSLHEVLQLLFERE
jgi:hypothetical protein